MVSEPRGQFAGRIFKEDGISTQKAIHRTDRGGKPSSSGPGRGKVAEGQNEETRQAVGDKGEGEKVRDAVERTAGII